MEWPTLLPVILIILAIVAALYGANRWVDRQPCDTQYESVASGSNHVKEMASMFRLRARRRELQAEVLTYVSVLFVLVGIAIFWGGPALSTASPAEEAKVLSDIKSLQDELNKSRIANRQLDVDLQHLELLHQLAKSLSQTSQAALNAKSDLNAGKGQFAQFFLEAKKALTAIQTQNSKLVIDQRIFFFNDRIGPFPSNVLLDMAERLKAAGTNLHFPTKP